MKLCVTSGIFGKEDAVKLTYGERAKFAKEAGFEEFDFSLGDPRAVVANGEKFYLDAFEDIKKEGIKIKYIHLPFYFPPEDDKEGWEIFDKGTYLAMDLSKKVGADCSVVHPKTYMKKDFDKDEEHSTQLEFLEPFVEYSNKIGITVAIENMRGAGASAHQILRRYCTDIDDLLSVADYFNIGVCWDTGHANISLQNQPKAIRKIGKRLKEVHINDNFAEDDVHIAPFIGNINWNDVMKAFKEVGFNGSLNMEIGCRNAPVEIRKYYAKYIAESGKQLIKLFNEA